MPAHVAGEQARGKINEGGGRVRAQRSVRLDPVGPPRPL